MAKGLLHLGLKKGDGVAFMCHTSYAWDVFDAAVLAVGGVLATVRRCGTGGVHDRAQVGLLDRVDALVELRVLDLLVVVPRVLEKVYNAASQKAGNGPKGRVFAASVVAAQKYMEELSTRGKASRFATARRNAFDPIVYSQIRDVLGGWDRCRPFAKRRCTPSPAHAAPRS